VLNDDKVKMLEAANQMMQLNSARGNAMIKLANRGAGVLVDNEGDLERLDGLLSTSRLTLKEIGDARISNGKQGVYLLKLVTQRDRLVQQATSYARSHFQPDLDVPESALTEEQRLNTQRYKLVEGEILNARIEFDNNAAASIRAGKPLAVHFDAIDVAKKSIGKVELKIKEQVILQHNRYIKRTFQRYWKFDLDDYPKDRDGIEKILRDKPTHLYSTRYRKVLKFYDKLEELQN
jgi:hypothetical protein